MYPSPFGSKVSYFGKKLSLNPKHLPMTQWTAFGACLNYARSLHRKLFHRKTFSETLAQIDWIDISPKVVSRKRHYPN